MQMDRIFALLDEFDTKATFFVLGAAVESRPGIVRAIVDGDDYVMPSTIEDPASLDEIKALL